MMLELNKIYNMDCIEGMKQIDSNSIDAVVTDPPYGLSFMGKHWDYDVPKVEIWQECLRVLKPGGCLLSFAGTRTYHRMAVNIEDAGFEIRDMIVWVYGSGFPKSLNIGKAIDKLQGNEREFIGYGKRNQRDKKSYAGNSVSMFAENKIEALRQTKGQSEWEGWGTALKPALEPVCVARKPLSEKTVAENVLKWDTGGINIDGCRIGTEERTYGGMSAKQPDVGTFRDDNWEPKDIQITVNGRFPANFIHDGSDEVVGLFPQTGGGKYSKGCVRTSKESVYELGFKKKDEQIADAPDNYGDSGSASRFFYCAKASKSERNRGCEGLEDSDGGIGDIRPSGSCAERYNKPKPKPTKNFHPTVKPIALMEYLIKLVSRKGALILDLFAGSGTTGIACKRLERNYILIEREKDYCEIAEKRIEAEIVQTRLCD